MASIGIDSSKYFIYSIFVSSWEFSYSKLVVKKVSAVSRGKFGSRIKLRNEKSLLCQLPCTRELLDIEVLVIEAVCIFNERKYCI